MEIQGANESQKISGIDLLEDIAEPEHSNELNDAPPPVQFTLHSDKIMDLYDIMDQESSDNLSYNSIIQEKCCSKVEGVSRCHECTTNKSSDCRFRGLRLLRYLHIFIRILHMYYINYKYSR